MLVRVSQTRSVMVLEQELGEIKHRFELSARICVERWLSRPFLGRKVGLLCQSLVGGDDQSLAPASVLRFKFVLSVSPGGTLLLVAFVSFVGL